MALSQLDLGPEWFCNGAVTCTEAEFSVTETELLSTESKNPSSEEIPVPTILSTDLEKPNRPECPLIEPDSLSTALKNQSSELEIVRSKILTDLEKYEENKRLCHLHSFKPPIYFRKFEKMVWRYVRTFNPKDLETGSQFRTLEELSSIPRKHAKPFCHPGPEKRCELYDWYLVDSIVQEVYVKSDMLPNYVVRWVGYEDEYNTVEPLAYVKDTAIYKLFTSPHVYTACRSNNVCIRRRSKRSGLKEMIVKFQMELAETKYQRTIAKLVSDLQIEEKANRYSPEIGFYSYESVTDALMAQHRFFIDKFLLLLRELNSAIYLDHHYIGEICGNLHTAIYYDPAPKCFGHGVPKVLDELKKPVMRSFTQKFGAASEKDDCVFKCMCYIIGLATEEIAFEPDFSEPSRKIDQYLAGISSKKPKIEY